MIELLTFAMRAMPQALRRSATSIGWLQICIALAIGLGNITGDTAGLPDASAATTRDASDHDNGVVLFVRGRDDLLWEDNVVTDLAVLRAKVAALEKTTNPPRLYLWAAPDQSFGTVTSAIPSAGIVNYPKISFIAEALVADPKRRAAALSGAVPLQAPLNNPDEVVDIRIDIDCAILWNEEIVPDRTAFVARIAAGDRQSAKREYRIKPEILTPWKCAVDTMADTEQLNGKKAVSHGERR